VEACIKCRLSQSRILTVPGEGNPKAEIIFIGEAPGANEDKTGVPFCGAAGKFLDEMLNVIGMDRNDVFITNTVKCRPPENRDPEEDEKAACRPYLERQFNAINPKLIICLGKHSVETFLPGAGSITKLHGKALRRPNGKVYLALYHPAAALHNGSLRETLITDFKKIPEILKKVNQMNEDNSSKNDDDISQPKLI
jgi:DNA polymerase